MMVRWPQKIEPNTTSSHVSAFWNVLPTISEIENIDKPKDIDGISFLSSLVNEPQPEHDYLYWEFHELGGKQAVRMGK